MKILIATGIFPPEIGGPATYAPALADKFVESGNEVVVVTFANVEDKDAYAYRVVRVFRGNKILNRIRFFFALLREARGVDIIYTLDWFTAGLPLALAAKLLRKPYVVRVGGDILWEQKFLEHTTKPMTLGDFYMSDEHRKWKYRIHYLLIKWVLRGARHVIFNSDEQRQIYVLHYHLEPALLATIHNPVPREELADIKRGEVEKEFVYWGRFIAMKNIVSLVRAFAKADLPEYRLVLIGDGPRFAEIGRAVVDTHMQDRIEILSAMPRHEALERVKSARAFVLPSWTDISPNQVYEALAIGLPALVTKENYLAIKGVLPEQLDPHSIDDIAAKLELLGDEKKYSEFVRRFDAIVFKKSWDDVAREHLTIFKYLLV
jgi:glycosyltransferase involved in cell wall biosynthesis